MTLPLAPGVHLPSGRAPGGTYWALCRTRRRLSMNTYNWLTQGRPDLVPSETSITDHNLLVLRPTPLPHASLDVTSRATFLANGTFWRTRRPVKAAKSPDDVLVRDHAGRETARLCRVPSGAGAHCRRTATGSSTAARINDPTSASLPGSEGHEEAGHCRRVAGSMWGARVDRRRGRAARSGGSD